MTPSDESRPSSPLLMAAPLLVLLAFLAVGLRTVSNTDFWMETAIGRAVLDAGPFANDTLTHIGEGKPYVKAGWLYGVVMYLAQNAGGGVVTLLHLGSVAAAFWLLSRQAMRQSGPVAVGFALLLCLWLISPRLDARPAVFSLVFPAAMIAILSAQPRGIATLVKLVILQVLWVNMHTTFLAGPVIALAFAAEAFGGGSRHSTLTKSDAPGLLVLAAAMLGAAHLNPYVHRIFAHLLQPDAWAGMTDPAASIAQGWTQPFITPFANDFAHKGSAMLINMVMLLAAGGLIFYRDALPYARTALAVVAAVLAMKFYMSSIELFTVLIFPLLALSTGCLGTFFTGLARGNPAQAGRISLAGASVLGVLAAVTIVRFVSNSYYIERGIPTRFGLGFNREIVPAEAMEVINRPDFPANFIHLPADGGYLETHLTKGRMAFIDARQALHAGAYADLVDALVGADKEKSEAANKRMFGNWQPGAAVINTTLPYAQDALGRLLASGMLKPAYFDGTTAILVVPTRENIPLLTDKAVQEKGLAILEETKNRYRKALGGLPAPLSARLLGAANAFVVMNRPQEAQAVLAALRAGNPTLYSGRLNLAMVQRALKDNEGALTTLNEAMALEPTDAKPHLIRADVLKAMGRDKDAEDAAAEAKRLAPKKENVPS